ncbi:MAG: 50S ribosomal protein L32e [Candidatus Bathyarchaeota archaeon]|nr:50S ribosomal protein L32e [Candidatus Bathyarchaeota archaeon]
MAEKDVSAIQKALAARKRAKQKKPEFVKSESWRYVRVKAKWRRPRGIDNKMRQKVKGWPPSVNTGYRGPKEVRGLHPSGYKEVLVHTPEEIANIDPKTEAVRIAHTVGKKKRVQILSEAKKRNLIVLNFKSAMETVKEEIKQEEPSAQPAEQEIKKKVDSKEEKKPASKKKESKEDAKEEKPKKARSKTNSEKGDETQ